MVNVVSVHTPIKQNLWPYDLFVSCQLRPKNGIIKVLSWRI